MPRQFKDLPAAENPFEHIGLDRKFIEILLSTGDDSLVVALKSMRRSVSRTLHPDTNPGSTPEAQDFFNDFVVASDKLETLTGRDRATLAEAFAKKGARQRTKEVSYESADFYNGSIVSSMAEIVGQSHESIASFRNKRLLIRPLDFSLSKPAGAPAGRQWYPPESARVSLVSVGPAGQTSWEYVRQSSFSGELKTDLRANDVREEQNQIIKAISEPLWAAVGSDDYANLVKKDEVLSLIQKDGTIEVIAPSGDVLNVVDAPELPETALADGIYHFGFSDSNRYGGPHLIDKYYVFDDKDDSTDQAYLFGLADTDFLEIQRKSIYSEDTREFGQAALPSTAKRQQRFSFSVPNKMRKFLERSYTPKLPDSINSSQNKKLVLAADESGSVQVMGSLIFLADLNR